MITTLEHATDSERTQARPLLAANQRVAELDGIRGLAAAMVFLYHWLPRSLAIHNARASQFINATGRIGWMGVDIFFVLSGFLITVSLLEAKGKPRFFVNFYGRRALRIFPLYYIALIGIFVLFPLIDSTFNAKIAGFQPWYFVFLQNWIYALRLAEPADYIGQFWSLAIEEQFYLLWPLLVARLSRTMLIGVAGTVVALAPLLRFFSDTVVPKADADILSYTSTLTRIDGLMLGALLALLSSRVDFSRYLRWVWLTAGLALAGITGCILYNTESILWENPPMYIVGISLIAITASCMIIIATAAPPSTLLRRCLRSRAMRFLGDYSYAIYLLHMPVIFINLLIFKHLHLTGRIAWLLFFASCALMTAGAALASWKLIESRALRLKRFF